MAVKRRHLLYDYLESFYCSSSPHTKELGVIPVIVLDTSAIMDIEKAFVKSGKKTGAVGLEQIAESARGMGKVKFVVTDRVTQECADHHYHLSSNGYRNGLGDIIFSAVRGFNLTARDENLLFRYNTSELSGFDEMRYGLRELFSSTITGKKAEQDPISPTDLDIIDASMFLAQKSAEQFAENIKQDNGSPLENVYRTIVLSSDAHVNKALNLFLSSPDGARYLDYLRPVNAREYFLVEEGKR
ncbi:hypothetical protein HOC13_03950 [Candidatus Woesearchaeota archaeon]|jgi:hypothetical protein|nr:hypothetical protein [Candidatus Woesearchaeota archaeon]